MLAHKDGSNWLTVLFFSMMQLKEVQNFVPLSYTSDSIPQTVVLARLGLFQFHFLVIAYILAIRIYSNALQIVIIVTRNQ